MKTTQSILWTTLAVLMVSACGGNTSSKTTVMMEMVDDPLEGLPKLYKKNRNSSQQIAYYKLCMTGVPSDMLEELKEEAKKMADTKSVTKIEQCPVNFDAYCKGKSMSKYYYRARKRILQEAKAGCEYLKDKWIVNNKEQ